MADPATAEAAVRGAWAVVIAYGLPTRSRSPLYTDGTRAIVEAMRYHGVSRLVVVSEAAYGRHVRGVPARAVSALYRAVNTPLIRQRVAQDALVESAGLEWTFVRPTRLTDRDPGTDPAPASHVPLTSRLPVTGYGRLGALIVTQTEQPIAHHHDLYV
ncbi:MULTISPECIES: NAD(P)H-binding protein [unclassified Streptomyces]|uniref:NAD(P)H-binding protein n=1 Tax=unclassified Streptomyces TaxID=2593676 RepID=UPI0037F354FF